MDKLFKVETKNHIAWLTLNRPEKMNMMNLAFFDGLANHFNAFDNDPSIWVVVIKAEGGSFSVGMDVETLSSIIAKKDAKGREETRKLISKIQSSINTIEKCRKPVISAINGHCIGGAVDLISACDIRLASRDAIFSIRETKMGIVADIGTLQRLPYIIGHGWFRELALTGRDFMAEEALNMGLVTHLCEDQDQLIKESRKIAQQIASCPPLAVQGTKDCILYNRDNGVSAGLDYVAQKNAALLPNEDLMEALAAFQEKRKPVFKGL